MYSSTTRWVGAQAVDAINSPEPEPSAARHTPGMTEIPLGGQLPWFELWGRIGLWPTAVWLGHKEAAIGLDTCASAVRHPLRQRQSMVAQGSIRLAARTGGSLRGFCYESATRGTMITTFRAVPVSSAARHAGADAPPTLLRHTVTTGSASQDEPVALAASGRA